MRGVAFVAVCPWVLEASFSEALADNAGAELGSRSRGRGRSGGGSGDVGGAVGYG